MAKEPAQEAKSTTETPDLFFSPLSYSMSIDTRQCEPPMPAIQLAARDSLISESAGVTEAVLSNSRWNRNPTLSPNFTPRSLLDRTSNKPTALEAMKRDVEDLLQYIDNLAFTSPQMQTNSVYHAPTTTPRSQVQHHVATEGGESSNLRQSMERFMKLPPRSIDRQRDASVETPQSENASITAVLGSAHRSVLDDSKSSSNRLTNNNNGHSTLPFVTRPVPRWAAEGIHPNHTASAFAPLASDQNSSGIPTWHDSLRVDEDERFPNKHIMSRIPSRRPCAPLPPEAFRCDSSTVVSDDSAIRPIDARTVAGRNLPVLRDRTNKPPKPECTPLKPKRNPAIRKHHAKDPSPLRKKLTVDTRPDFAGGDGNIYKSVVNTSDTVRRGLDPEPMQEVSLDDSESIILGTAFEETESSGGSKGSRATSDHDCHHSEEAGQRHIPGLQINTVESSEDFAIAQKFLVQSPEDARQLLRTAVAALHEARSERESARIWAKSMKDSVHKWAEEQRNLIETGRQSSPVDALIRHQQQVQKQTEIIFNLESAVRSLQDELKSTNKDRQVREERLQHLLLDQQERIRELSMQLASMEHLVSEGSRIASAEKSNKISPDRDQLPSFVNKARSTASKKSDSKSLSESTAASSTGRVRRQTKDGGYVIDYGNGVSKEKYKDGTTIVRFPNGDYETRFPGSNTVAYFHAYDRVIQITKGDGSILYEYANKQIERHYPDGSKAILFPDGTKQRISASGKVETLFAS